MYLEWSLLSSSLFLQTFSLDFYSSYLFLSLSLSHTHTHMHTHQPMGIAFEEIQDGTGAVVVGFTGICVEIFKFL